MTKSAGVVDVPSPTALLSWAHESPGWDDARAATWEEEVVEFVRELRARGIDVDLDLHHAAERGGDWTRFGPRAVSDKEWVIVALSPGWRDRWEGTNDPTVGAGVAGEADALLSIYQENQEKFREKLVLVTLPSMQHEDLIPKGLHGVHRFTISEISLGGIEDLLRLLTGQPKRPAEPLGTIPHLPPAVPSQAPSSAEAPKAQERPNEGTGESRTRTTLEVMLDDPDADVRYDALSALRDRLTPEILPRIEAFLDDPDPYMRRLAIDCLGR